MLAGHVGRIEADVIGGWAADTDAPDVVVDVIIYIDGKRAARVSCDRYRPDLHDLQIYGEGHHGFEWRISPPLPLQTLDRVTVRLRQFGCPAPRWGTDTSRREQTTSHSGNRTGTFRNDSADEPALPLAADLHRRGAPVRGAADIRTGPPS